MNYVRLIEWLVDMINSTQTRAELSFHLLIIDIFKLLKKSDLNQHPEKVALAIEEKLKNLINFPCNNVQAQQIYNRLCDPYLRENFLNSLQDLTPKTQKEMLSYAYTFIKDFPLDSRIQTLYQIEFSALKNTEDVIHPPPDTPCLASLLEQNHLLFSLSSASPVIDDITQSFPELINYPLGVGISATSNLAALLKNIPQLVTLRGNTTQSLSDIARAISLPDPVSLGVCVAWNWLDGIACIINGINLMMNDEKHHENIQKLKSIINIISGAQALAFSYHPKIVEKAGLTTGPASFAGAAFAVMVLSELINTCIDFYYAAKEKNIAGWFSERVKEINHLDKKIKKLKKKRNIVCDEDTEELFRKFEKKINPLIEKKQMLINHFNSRSKIYCYGDQDEPLNLKNPSEFKRRMACIESLLKLIRNDYVRIQADFRLMPTTIKKAEKTFINSTIRPSIEELALEKELDDALKKTYQALRFNLIMKGLSFAGMTLLALAPFAGPATAILYGTGLPITLFVTATYIYKHRDKLQNAGNFLLSTAKNAIFFGCKENDHALTFTPRECDATHLLELTIK